MAKTLDIQESEKQLKIFNEQENQKKTREIKIMEEKIKKESQGCTPIKSFKQWSNLLKFRIKLLEKE